MTANPGHQHSFTINNDGDHGKCACGSDGYPVFIEADNEDHAQQIFDRLSVAALDIAQNEQALIASAFQVLKHAMETDPELAWGWHCNIAMASVDQGMHPHAANRAAAIFMRAAFEIDITRSEQWIALDIPPTATVDVSEQTQTPTPNNSLTHRAAGNLGFLLSTIRCGEPLSAAEEANVRSLIDELEGRKPPIDEAHELAGDPPIDWKSALEKAKHETQIH